ncbi:Hydroxyneurosporene synthase [Penicillium odoratum]|uniref:Hydroxyneurosporene synthase n=1 Tax=Penicillium odoratum TaxID=1167516 RepID=UPI0025469E29|nr:Hydroxyneurosporene synthase [Penicillium odoratum]KAJ5772475.1 Hydroxyneurosporene synthase [Penicillium odoratum]
MYKQFLYVLKGLLSLIIIPTSASPNPNPTPLIPFPFPSPNSLPQTQTGYTYKIPRGIQNGTANARFTIPTPNKTLNTTSRLILDTPRISKVTTTSFDWWYFDAVSTTTPAESLTITLFTSSSSAFPWLDSSESSVLISYLWAAFPNGSVFEEYLPATIATLSETSNSSSSGLWSDTGFTWVAGEELSPYRVTVESEEMGVLEIFRNGILKEQSPHLPCGIQDEISTLEIVPNVGWTSLIPDAGANVDMSIQGSRLRFQGRGYHDKNWSNLPFTESISSWYWGHGRVGNYSIVWFSAIANNQNYTSSYVAQNDQVLVSSCEDMFLTVRPAGHGVSNSNSTAARYPPRAGDIPDGFTVQAYLGEGVWLKVSVSIVVLVTGDWEYYMRWSGGLVGSLVDSEGRVVDAGKGVAVFEQFALEE